MVGLYLWIMVCLPDVRASHIFYGGLIIPRTSQSSPSCIQIIEISDKQVLSNPYSKEAVASLLLFKPSIAQHIENTLAVDSSQLAQYLQDIMTSKRPHVDCFSYTDYKDFVRKSHGRDLRKKMLMIDSHLMKNDYFESKCPIFSVNNAAVKMAGNLFDQYILRRNSAPLKEVYRPWKVDEVFMTDAAYEGYGLDFLRKLLYFKTYHNYVGSYFEREKTHKSQQMQAQKQFFDKDKFNSVRLRRLDTKVRRELLKIAQQSYYTRKKGGPSLSQLEALSHFKRLKSRFDAEEELQIKRAIQREYKIDKKVGHRTHTLREYLELRHRYYQGKVKGDELARYRMLRAEIYFGIRPDVSLLKGKFKFAMVDFLKFYNFYLTDTIADKMTDYAFSPTITQMRPMSKKRCRYFRLSKASDGFFVLTTTLTGLILVPFTGGASFLAANLINIGTTGFFSLTTSAAMKEPLDSIMFRLGLRSAHTFAEGFVAPWALVNGFFTSIDDLRVASGGEQLFARLFRKRKVVKKYHPQMLGKPYVLSLLRDRIHYLEKELLPLGFASYAGANFSRSQRLYYEEKIAEGLQILQELKVNYINCYFRYRYLLKRGRIPDHMLREVVLQLNKNKALAARIKVQKSDNLLDGIDVS